MASIDLYTKQQIDAKIPDTTGVTSGYVLTFNGTNTVWASAGGGGGSANTGDILAATVARILDYYAFTSSSSYEKYEYIKDDGTKDVLTGSNATITVLGTSVTLNYSAVTIVKAITLEAGYQIVVKSIGVTFGGNNYTIYKTMIVYDDS